MKGCPRLHMYAKMQRTSWHEPPADHPRRARARAHRGLVTDCSWSRSCRGKGVPQVGATLCQTLRLEESVCVCVCERLCFAASRVLYMCILCTDMQRALAAQRRSSGISPGSIAFWRHTSCSCNLIAVERAARPAAHAGRCASSCTWCATNASGAPSVMERCLPSAASTQPR